MWDPTEYRADGPDPYIDPATGLLRNIPNLTNYQALQAFERTIFMGVFAQSQALIDGAPHFDLALWQKLHHACFADIYPWAGQLRCVRIEKGATVFAYPECIEGQAALLFDELNNTTDIKGLIRLFGELNIIHPFREGNGRTQRMLFAAAFGRLGYDFRYEHLQSAPLIAAQIAAYNGQYGPLYNLLEPVIYPINLS